MIQNTNSRRRVALIYIRKSVVRDKRDEVSPERQLALCEDEARRHGWTAEVFKDAEGHRSGGSEKKRPEWQRLKKQLVRPDVAAVIVTDISRAGRSRRDLHNFLGEIDQRGIQLLDLKYKFDTTTAAGRLMLGMLINVLAWEREVDSERMIDAIHFKRERGKHVGLAPFGTKRDANGLLVESEDWPACSALLETYAAGAHSYLSLAAHLNALGHRFRNRERQLVPFDREAVRSVVNNTLAYAGYVLKHKGRHVDISLEIDDGDDLLGAIAKHTGAIRGLHAPLISHELAARIVAVRRRSLRPHGKSDRRVYILAPVAFCANCGRPLRGIQMHGIPRYYHGRESCVPRGHRIEAGPLERDVLSRLRAMRLPVARRDDLRRLIERRIATAPEHAEVVAAIHALDQKRERLKSLFIEGDIDREQYDSQRRSVATAIAGLQDKLGPARVDLDVVFAQLDSIADILARGTPQQQRRAVVDLFERVEIDLRGKVARMIPKPWVQMVFREFCEQTDNTNRVVA